MAATQSVPGGPPRPLGACASGLVPQGACTSGLTLVRERNGWCLHSAQIWLALELKCLSYSTVLELADASPRLLWPDGHEQREPLEMLRELDVAFPEPVPLWPSLDGVAADVDEMIGAFATAMPSARASSRAGYLFRSEEGFLYDPLPREVWHDGPNPASLLKLLIPCRPL